MKRLLVVSNMYPSPALPYFGVFVERQVRALRSHGVECSLAVSARRGGSPLRAARKYLGLAAAVRREARRSPPQAILAHFVYPTGLIALATGRRRGAPVAVVAHGGDLELAGKPEWVRRGTRTVLGRAALVVAVSRPAADDALAAGADRRRIIVAGMGYDDEAFVPRSRAEARARLGLDATRPIAVMVGNLIERKGVGTIVEAAAAASMPDLRWVIVGGGDPAVWQARARAAGSAGSVVFAGPATPAEVPWWLAAADVAVAPSHREAYGVAAVEALACGIPVVASRTGGLAEIVSDEATGLLVEPRDPTALATAVARLLADDALRSRLAAAGPAAAAPHSAFRQAGILLDALDRLVG